MMLLIDGFMSSWEAPAAVMTAIIGALLTFFRMMGSQGRKIDTLARDLKENQKDLLGNVASLRSQMENRFERLEDRNQTFITHREFYRFVERLRQANAGKQIEIPSPFGEEER